MDRVQELREKAVPLLRPFARQIAVFGSYARGEQTETSDIDLLVNLKPPEERPPLGLKWFSLEAELSQIMNRPVELVSNEGLSPYIRPYIENEKIIIYEEG